MLPASNRPRHRPARPCLQFCQGTKFATGHLAYPAPGCPPARLRCLPACPVRSHQVPDYGQMTRLFRVIDEWMRSRPNARTGPRTYPAAVFMTRHAGTQPARGPQPRPSRRVNQHAIAARPIATRQNTSIGTLERETTRRHWPQQSAGKMHQCSDAPRLRPGYGVWPRGDRGPPDLDLAQASMAVS